ncbi:response regulator [Psychrosphaera haliotis]|uniref:Response regulator n=1 Tax=Psychrosphaera haliotis TaxID=555083 RepID=A0A6N8F8E8_9GAMM|nr:response regulator [Psychrosphaera haliotis]MUH71132.1 response regulator [Psychrosphaera haliotis]
MHKINVLLVDDEYFNFEMLDITLGDSFNISYAKSGQSALSKVVSDKPDVLLLDVCMPGLDGYDTCRLIKNTPETSKIPIIMLSGLENTEDKSEAFKSGCDDYVTKPFEIEELKEKLITFANLNKG